MRAMFVAALAALAACSQAPDSAVAQPAATPTEDPRAQTGLTVVPLVIRSGGTDHRFQVQVAATAGEQSRGLMFRRRVAPNEGMIFPFDPPRPASFWMKNTVIPLDMLFIRADGTIARIAANTVPLSLDGVGVGEPVAAVLELAGGRSAELGIREGDHVRWGGALAR